MEDLTLVDIVDLLKQNGYPLKRARERVGEVFRSRRLMGTPSFTFPYIDIEIDWKTGGVKLQRPVRQNFTPRFDAQKVSEVFSCATQDRDIPMQKYQPPYLKILLKAIEEHNITKGNQPKAETLRDWFMSQEVGGEPISKNLAKAMTTIVRMPERKRGGAIPKTAAK